MLTTSQPLFKQAARPLLSQAHFFTAARFMTPISQLQQRAPLFNAQSLFYQTQMQHFSARQQIMYGTDTPAKSGRYQRGLYHKKTHGRRFQRCFSMKKSLITMKPNVKSRNLRSEVLNQSFKIEISMKARKCIIKAGSLDNYLLRTHPKNIDSKFGLYLRELIKKKQQDPAFTVPYIQGSARLPRTRKTTIWEYKQVPAIYMPAHVKISEDHAKYYMKSPADMSRYEISQLEQVLKELDEPDEFVADEEMQATPEFEDLKIQMRAIQPIRHGIFRKYFQKFKYQKKKRERLLQLIEDSEELPKEILGEEFIGFRQAIPEIPAFLAQIEEKEKLLPPKTEEEILAEQERDEKQKQKKKKKRVTGDGVDEKDETPSDAKLKAKKAQSVQEIAYDPDTFNPFGEKATKLQEDYKPLQPRKILKQVTK